MKSANQGVQPRQPAAARSAVASTKSRRLFVISVVLFVLALVIGAWTWYRYHQGSASINTDRYQAVTLDSGQVYFGKLANVGGAYVKLTDVYYFQAKDGSAEGEPADAAGEGSNPTLVKHGTELKNPEDEMFISKDDIAFWENLKDSGKVVDAIKNYKNQQGQ